MNDGTTYTGGGQPYGARGDMILSNQPLYHRHPACHRDCRYGEVLSTCNSLQGLINQMTLQIHKRKVQEDSMSQAIWCDPGAHAFSAKDPGRRRLSGTSQDPDTGEEVTEVYDMCSQHSVKLVAEPKAISGK